MKELYERISYEFMNFFMNFIKKFMKINLLLFSLGSTIPKPYFSPEEHN